MGLRQAFVVSLLLVLAPLAFAQDAAVVRVGTYENRPKIFTDKSGQTSGFWPDVIAGIASEEGLRIEYVHGTWTECLARLERGEIDVMPDVAFSEERARVFEFSRETVYVSWSRIFASRSAGVESILDLEGKRIAVLKGSINVEGPEGLKSLLERFGIRCTLVESDSYLSVFQQIKKGAADAGVVSKDFAYAHAQEFDLVPTPIVFQPSRLHFAFHRGGARTPALKEVFDRRIAQMKAGEQSAYNRALKQWFGLKLEEQPVIPLWAQVLLLGASGLALAMFVTSMAFRVQAKRRTAEAGQSATTRLRAEQAQREAEARYQAIIEGSSEGILVADAETQKFVYANAAICRMLGYSQDEIVKLGGADIYPQEASARAKADFDARVGNGQAYRTSQPCMRKDGTLFHAEFSTARVIVEGRNCLVDFITDSTERIRADAALRESEQRFKGLADSIGDVFFAMDKDYRYIYWNRASEKLTAISAANALGKTLYEVFPGVGGTSAEEVYRRVLETRTSIAETLDFEIRGKTRVFELSAYPMGEGIAVLARDITERQAAQKTFQEIEEQMRQMQKLEAVGRLAGGIAHDFNNILTAQIGFCDLIAGRPHDPSSLAKDLAQIRACADRAASLTRQLLAFSRKQTLQSEVLDLNAVVTNVEKMLKRLIGEDIDLATVLAPSLWRVKADAGQVEQVILNLAVNARDAMPHGGKLTIETANAEIREDAVQRHGGIAPGSYVMLSVADTGGGMDEATKLRLFEPFFTTKGPGRGTGLGLATVYGIVKQSGGGISVSSEPGRGATFKICMPRVHDELVAKPAVEKGTTRGSGQLVLFVEDEPLIRELLAQMLEGLGYRVRAAAQGEEALKLVEEDGLRPDLLITDVVMPGMGGRELAERLSRKQPGLKILYTSGYTDDAIGHHGVLDQGIPFLQKPFSIVGLAGKVAAVINAK